jgi:hypothetical protein
MKTLTTALLLVALSSSLGAQSAVIDYDQAASNSVFVDVGGGVKTSTFNVTDNLQTLVFLVYFAGGNPVVQFVDPQGNVLGLDASNITVQRTDWGLIAGLSAPALGSWTLQLSQTLGEGSYQVKTVSVPAIPTVALTSPSAASQNWSSTIAVSGSTQPGQAGQTVQIMVTQGGATTGAIAGETTVAADGSFQYALDPTEFAPGTYNVVASLLQANGPSIKATAAGSLVRSTPALLAPMTGVLFTVEQPSNLIVNFTNPYGRTPVTFRLHVVDASGIDHPVDLGLQTQARITGFAPGAAQVRVAGVDGLGRESQSGPSTAVTFGLTQPAAPALTLANPTVSMTITAGGSSSTSFALSGSFAGIDPSVALVTLTLPDLPAGLGIAPNKATWSLPADASQLTLSIQSTAALTPGTYSLPLTFSTVGVPSNQVVGTLNLQVLAPAVTVNQVSPNEWIAGNTPSILISGQNFGVGTIVQVDGQEWPIVSLTPQLITVQAPASLTSGAHTLAVINNDGSQSTAVLTVDAPAYAIVAYKSVSEAIPGGHARYWLALQSLNGYTGSTTFQVGSLPSGWTASVTPPTAVPGQTNVNIVDVTVPASAPLGQTVLNVTTPEGGQITLTVNVVSSLAPYLSSMSTYAELAGNSFTIYGYGFGTTAGTITVDSQTWPTTSWADDTITVTVPAGAATGLLRVKDSLGRISNGITFGVKDYGFHFVSNQLNFNLQGGDTDTFGVQLTGYQQAVNLAAQSISPLVQVSLDHSSVTPTGLVNVTLTLDKNIPVGTYPVTITGNSGLFQSQLNLQVVVGQALQFTTKALPPAMAGTNYGAQLGSLNAIGTATYTLANGVLPQGITLSTAGLLSGRATQSGRFRVVLQVADTASHTTQKEYVLSVEPTNWGRFGKDESQSWSSPVDAPADARTLWTSAPLGAPTAFLSGGNNLYLQTAAGVTALYAATGAQQFRISGSLTGLMYSQGDLLALDANGTLHAWDAGFGNELWHRDNVVRWWNSAGTVLAESQGQVMVIDAVQGTLTSTVTADLSGTLVGWRGQLYRLQGAALQLWSNAAGWTTLYTDPKANLATVSGDCVNLYVRNALGVTSLWNGSTMTVLWAGPVMHLVVADQWLAVDTGAAIEIRDRSTGALIRSWQGGGYDELFGSENKLFAVRGSTLTAINAWTGNTIWTSSGTLSLLAGDRAASVDSQGVVSVYNAPENLKAPVTVMLTVPAVPGSFGWFTTAPQVTLSATDAETYAASTVWKVDGGAWQTYQPLTLTDGVHTFAWHSVDSEGLTEADHLATLSVDTVPPVSSLAISPAPLPSLTAVWGGSVTLTLTAQDATSGLAGISYQINGGAWQTYSQPVTLSAEGLYSFAYRSQDQAGNLEAAHTQSLALDFHDPIATAQVQQDQGASFVYLSGTADAPIGLDHLEYQVGSGAVTTFNTVIPFTTSGSWTVAYRAVDKAGRTSVWQTVNVINNSPGAGNPIGRIQYAPSLKNRQVDPRTDVGDPIFTNTSARFAALPPELNGAAYLRGANTDSESTANPWITVTFAAPATVYYLQDPASKASLSGWTTAGSLAGSLLSPTLTVTYQEWTKTVAAGDTITFQPPKLTHVGGDLIFIQTLWTGVEIVAPAPGATFAAGQTVAFQAYTGGLPATLNWTVQEPGRPPQSLGSGTSVSYTVSSAADGGQLTVSVSGTVGGQRVQDQASWPLLRQEHLTVVFPNPITPVLAATAFTPRVFYLDSQGMPANPPAITWTATQAGKTVFQGAAPITIKNAGAVTLTGTLTSATGRTVTATTSFTVVAQWPWITWHWHDKKRQPWSDPDGEGFWGGLLPDDTQGSAQTSSGQLTIPVWRWTAGAEWRTTVDNGTYELVFAVGPFAAWDVHTVTVNGQTLNLQTKTAGQVLSVRFVVTVTDGTLRIRGTPGLPFYKLNYRRTTDQAPSASIVGVLTNPEDLQ